MQRDADINQALTRQCCHGPFAISYHCGTDAELAVVQINSVTADKFAIVFVWLETMWFDCSIRGRFVRDNRTNNEWKIQTFCTSVTVLSFYAIGIERFNSASRLNKPYTQVPSCILGRLLVIWLSSTLLALPDALLVGKLKWGTRPQRRHVQY